MREIDCLFRWYGGKGQIAGWIAQYLRALLPYTTRYVEPYIGGASVYLQFAPPPSVQVVLGDADARLVHFYRWLQSGEVLREWGRIRRILYAKYEYHRGNGAYTPLRFWLHQVMGYSGMPYHAGGWSSAKIVRRHVASSINSKSRLMRELPAVQRRFARAEIVHQDALETIQQYDSPSTLFYLDPPYHPETRKSQQVYVIEADASHHQALVQRLLQIQGWCVLSGYAHPDYEPLERAGWQRVERVHWARVHSTPSIRTEVLWIRAPHPLPEVPYKTVARQD